MKWSEPLGAAGERAKIARKRKRVLDKRHQASMRRVEAQDRQRNSWRYKARSKWTSTDIKSYNDYLARKADGQED